MATYKIQIQVDDSDLTAKTKAAAKAVGDLDKAFRRLSAGAGGPFKAAADAADKVRAQAVGAATGIKDVGTQATKAAQNIQLIHVGFAAAGKDLAGLQAAMNGFEGAVARCAKHSKTSDVSAYKVIADTLKARAALETRADKFVDRHAIKEAVSDYKALERSRKLALNNDPNVIADSFLARQGLIEEIRLYREKAKAERESRKDAERLQDRAQRFVDKDTIRDATSDYQAQQAGQKLVDRHELQDQVRLYKEQQKAIKEGVDLQARGQKLIDRHELQEQVRLYKEQQKAQADASKAAKKSQADADKAAEKSEKARQKLGDQRIKQIQKELAAEVSEKKKAVKEIEEWEKKQADAAVKHKKKAADAAVSQEDRMNAYFREKREEKQKADEATAKKQFNSDEQWRNAQTEADATRLKQSQDIAKKAAKSPLGRARSEVEARQELAARIDAYRRMEAAKKVLSAPQIDRKSVKLDARDFRENQDRLNSRGFQTPEETKGMAEWKKDAIDRIQLYRKQAAARREMDQITSSGNVATRAQIKDLIKAHREQFNQESDLAKQKMKVNDTAFNRYAANVKAKAKADQQYKDGFIKAVTDEEIAQQVANAKMMKSNKTKADAAFKAAGIEVEGHTNIVKSLGMMVARFAVYHLMIGKATQLLNIYTQAIRESNAAADEQLKGMVDELPLNRKIAAQLKMPNDVAFAAKIDDIARNTGAPRGDVRQFLAGANAGGVSLIGEKEEDFGAGGAKVTKEQYLAAAQKALAFNEARGMDMNAGAALFAQALGHQDVHKMGKDAGANAAFKKFAVPFKVMEAGRGRDAALAQSLVEFDAAQGKQFDSLEEQSILMSIIAEGKPTGRTSAAGISLMNQLATPKGKDAEKALSRVTMANGKRLFKDGGLSDPEMKGNAVKNEIRGWLDKQGMSDQARQKWIQTAFPLRQGGGAAQMVFGAEWKSREAKAQRERDNAEKDLDADEKKVQGGIDMQIARAQQKTAGAKLMRRANAIEIEPELEKARWFREHNHIKDSFGDKFKRQVLGWVPGWDTSEETATLIQSQTLLEAQILKKDPKSKLVRSDVDRVSWGGDRDSQDRRLIQLKRERDRLYGIQNNAAPAAQPAAIADPIVAAVNANGDKMVAAINARNGGAVPVQAAPRGMPARQAPADMGDPNLMAADPFWANFQPFGQ